MQLGKSSFLVFLIAILRIGAALVLFYDVFLGFFATILFDCVDYWILKAWQGNSWDNYEVIDKVLDIVPYTIMLLLSLSHPAFLFIAILFIYRMIGEIIFFITKKEFCFIIFPNLFIVAFFGLVVARSVGLVLDMTSLKHVVLLTFFFIMWWDLELNMHFYWPKYFKMYGDPLLLAKKIFRKNK